ncbi:MAG: OB-fold nucleic acid binding domain-containing protein, partial [Aeromonas sp.]
MSEAMNNGAAELNKELNNEMQERRNKLAALRAQGNPFPNDFRREHFSGDLQAEFAGKTNDELVALGQKVTIAGRIMTRRIMGKASFATLQDMAGKIQIYVTRDDLAEGFYNEQFKKWDLGDIVGVEGVLFKTQTGELSVHVSGIRLLTKALRPLPEKHKGLTDQEARCRQRYLDLIANDDSRKTFVIRTQVVAGIRKFLNDKRFMEVETPMM